MTRKTITLTTELDAFVKTRVESGLYGNDSEYIRELVRRDQARIEAETTLGALIDEAEASGVSELSPREAWAAAEHDLPGG